MYSLGGITSKYCTVEKALTTEATELHSLVTQLTSVNCFPW